YPVMLMGQAGLPLFRGNDQPLTILQRNLEKCTGQIVGNGASYQSLLLSDPDRVQREFRDSRGRVVDVETDSVLVRRTIGERGAQRNRNDTLWKAPGGNFRKVTGEDPQASLTDDIPFLREL